MYVLVTLLGLPTLASAHNCQNVENSNSNFNLDYEKLLRSFKSVRQLKVGNTGNPLA